MPSLELLPPEKSQRTCLFKKYCIQQYCTCSAGANFSRPPSGPHRAPSTDGRMLLWDPVAANTPVASVTVGCPLNSACFSAGDPYALICAPELGVACAQGGRVRSGRSSYTGGDMSNDLVQIWDLR